MTGIRDSLVDYFGFEVLRPRSLWLSRFCMRLLNGLSATVGLRSCRKLGKLRQRRPQVKQR
jgi:hypothetical protein